MWGKILVPVGYLLIPALIMTQVVGDPFDQPKGAEYLVIFIVGLIPGGIAYAGKPILQHSESSGEIVVGGIVVLISLIAWFVILAGLQIWCCLVIL